MHAQNFTELRQSHSRHSQQASAAGSCSMHTQQASTDDTMQQHASTAGNSNRHPHAGDTLSRTGCTPSRKYPYSRGVFSQPDLALDWYGREKCTPELK